MTHTDGKSEYGKRLPSLIEGEGYSVRWAQSGELTAYIRLLTDARTVDDTLWDIAEGLDAIERLLVAEGILKGDDLIEGLIKRRECLQRGWR